MNRKFSPGSAAALLLLPTLFLAAPAPCAHAAAGDLDSLDASISGISSGVLATATQADGKIIIAGSFTSVLGVARQNIARLNADGTLDLGFAPSPNQAVASVAVQADGKVLLAGYFTSVGLNQRKYMARLNADGTLDMGFNPSPNGSVHSVAVQADGKILLGGDFTLLGAAPGGTLTGRDRTARLNADGTVDSGFAPPAVGIVRCLVVQPDGKILRAGTTGLGRLNADGTLDGAFNPGLGGVVYPHAFGVAVQADGKVVIGGDFTLVNGVTRNRIARVNADGTLDTGFNPNVTSTLTTTPDVSCVAVQVDGKVVFGGYFNRLQPNGGPLVTRSCIARVNADGTPDTGFAPNANSAVTSVAMQTDGKVLLGGSFNTLQPNGAVSVTGRNYFARLLNDPATQTLTVPSATQVLWTRGGAAPEVGHVAFELSTNGGANWSLLGTATRIGTTPNFQLTGLSLPTGGLIRARGRTAGGSGLTEQVVSFTFGPEIGATGNGVNIADGDTTPAAPDGTDFGAAALGATTVVRTFTITSTGTAALNLTGTPKVIISGANAADFAVTLQPASPLAATDGTTTFQVTITPGAAGVRNATLSIASNDADEATFDFAVTGRGLSYTTDTDGDGMNDASELMGAPLGFNWQVSQPALVQTYNGMANGAGLYTTSQVQALHMDVPLLQRTPGTNTFTFTFGLRKSTTLAPGSFVPFPFTPAGTSVNGAGKVQYQFTAPDNAAFFRLEMP